MSHAKLNRLIAGAVFLIALVLYLATMAPTFSFWDCGEFVASSVTLGVPHPPGSPMFLLLGRVLSMIPVGDPGWRVNLISVLSSALTVMLLYLICVQLIRELRSDTPDEWTTSERLAHYGGAVIGALAFAVSDSFWFNAVEAEVYAISMVFTALVVWLALDWSEESDEPGNERWLMLIAYVMGIAIGIHLLNILTLFFVAMLYYYKRYRVSFTTFLGLMAASAAVFLVIYPGLIKKVPGFAADIAKSSGNGAALFFLFAFVLAIVAGIWYAQTRGKRTLNLAFVATFLIVLGYSSYALVIIRSAANPPLDENNPETYGQLYSYLNREQYGDSPFIPRRWNQEYKQQYNNYSSDLDFFAEYQVQEMYNRYLGWNFIGKESDKQGAGVDFNKFFALPFLLGLFGAWWHFRRDWKRALAVLALFFMTGLAIVLYLNQTPLQPRERDYSYVGSFFAFAIWMGLGATGVMELVTESMADGRNRLLAMAGTGAAMLLFVPGRMLQVGYHEHDRSGNYVPWDYAYNMLQSCGPDAVLFTNGDNDTFPLWYLQEVARIRTDVRVVNLSLLQTDWYIKQLRDTEPRGAKKVAISFSDEDVNQLCRYGLSEWESQTVTLPVPADRFRGPSAYDDEISAPPTALSWTLRGRPFREGQTVLQVNDVLVKDIIEQNRWQRPIYFAITVASDNEIGLDDYLRNEGQVQKLVPVAGPPQLYTSATKLGHNLLEVYQYRNLDNPKVFLDENTLRLVQNYRFLFIYLAQGYAERGQQDKVISSLDFMEKVMPRSNVPLDEPRLAYQFAMLYKDAGAESQFRTYAQMAEPGLRARLGDPRTGIYYTTWLSDLLAAEGKYDEAVRVLSELKSRSADPQFQAQVDARIEDVRAQQAVGAVPMVPITPDTAKRANTAVDTVAGTGGVN